MKVALLIMMVFGSGMLFAQTQEGNSKKIDELNRRLDSLAGIRRAQSTCDSLYELNVKLLAQIQKLQESYDKNQIEIIKLEGQDKATDTKREEKLAVVEDESIEKEGYYVIVKSFRTESKAVDFMNENQNLNLKMSQNQNRTWYHLYCCSTQFSSDIVKETIYQRNHGFEQAWWVKGTYFVD